ncbi:MAG: MFS transporter [Actinobacteria bacterium]|nr:MAG: MFS transporter [Actinomycetota bacterium]
MTARTRVKPLFAGLPFGALAERDFRLLFIGRTISLFGSAFAPIALAFAVVRLTGSPSDLGLVLSAYMLAHLVFLLAGGVWADRLPRHLVMVTSDLLSGASQIAAAVVLLTGVAQTWHLVVLAALRGGASAFFMPASAGLVPQVVSAGRLQQANALLSLSRNSTRIAGVALAGVLVATVGPGWALGLDGATYGVGALFVGMLKLPPVEAADKREFIRELAEGWREFRSRSWLCVTIVQFALINAYAIGAFLVLGPFVAQRSLGGAAAWGLILAFEALGMILAGLVALRYRPERPLLVATLAVLTMAPLLALLGLAAPLLLILPAALIAGVGLELYGVFWDTTLQQHIPDEKLSRVSSYDVLGSFALIPVGVAVMGPISGAIGVADTLIGAAVVVVVATLAVVCVADVRNLRRLEPQVAPPRRAPVPQPARTRWLRPETAPAPAATRR